MAFKVRGVTLPAREEQTFLVDGDRLRTDGHGDAEWLSDGGWILPGLADLHTHPGTGFPTDTFTEEAFVSDLGGHRDAGVLVVRVPGSNVRLPEWVDDDPELPKVYSSGKWLATSGHFFPGAGRHVGLDELPRAAVEEASASSGWCKVIGDWTPSQDAVPIEVLTEVVTAVHEAGGRVAVHCQTAQGCHNAVHAGADSLEHGMNLDHGLLARMAAQGTVLVPTLTTFAEMIVEMDAAPEPGPNDTWLRAGWEMMVPMVGAAHEAGVTVLAGTDIATFGKVSEEVGWLGKAGLPADTALGAASWAARSWLGLESLVDGAPADLVIYDEDPALHPSVLSHPKHVVMRGRVIR
ncbi:amidohydrolase family protein [Amycolatopsis sp. cg5]|uniref:amidohydrolase family protein n=1 Tax=Amycolatopsis sp. cg5 TaxID=3238802 RepID=UPI003525CFD7